MLIQNPKGYLRCGMVGSSLTILSETPCADPHAVLWGPGVRYLRLPDYVNFLELKVVALFTDEWSSEIFTNKIIDTLLFVANYFVTTPATAKIRAIFIAFYFPLTF